MEGKARVISFALWVLLVPLGLLAIQTLPIFFHLPESLAIVIGVSVVGLGVYGYWADRLTPSKAVYATSLILLICVIPKALGLVMGWDWLISS